MKTSFVSFILLLLNVVTYAQPVQLDPAVFAQRRATFMARMDQNALAIFPSKPVYLRNLDIEYPYRQESNFYYLSGFEEPEAILLIDPSAPKYQYVMFVRERNRRRETYDGPRAGVEGAMTIFGADTALYVTEFESAVPKFIGHDRPIYYTFGINPERDRWMTHNFIERRSRGNWPIIDPAPILDQMRVIKNEGDLKMGLARAIDISAAAHVAAMKAIQPGMYEYEIQAVFEYVFRKNGSPRNGYESIVGSGPNSTILHYQINNRKLREGEMILMDCGAEFGYYSADVTRSVPTNGRFSQAQRDIYEIVLRAQSAAIEMVKPGIQKSVLDKAINEILGNGLVRLGLVRDKKDYRMFSLHGYSHWIGLEVHDVGAYTKNGKSVILQPGMVFTVEPGLYVRPDVFDKMLEKGYTEKEIGKIRPRVEKYMHIGVRIEDDILVTESGHKNLSAAAPRQIKDIESLMRAEPDEIVPASKTGTE